ncbi:MAG: amidohydrolase family protein, partial [Saprospiraceae bacterium]|nr:amidohydrolase family protein [Saprospiraceae bacterium]
PANYASEEEIVELAKVAAQYKGLYFTHMRNEMDGVLESIRESIKIGAKAGIPVEINHLKAAGKPQWGWSAQMLALIDSARNAGIEVTADVYPYMAYSTFSSILIPQWAMAGGREGLIKRLKDPVTRENIKAEMREIIMRDPGADDLSLIQFRDFDPDPAFKGKTLEDYALHLGKPLNLETTIDLLLDIETQGGFYGIFHAMSEDDLRNFIRHPLTMFDSDADLVVFGAEHPHPRCYGAFPRVIEKYVKEEGLLTLEEAVRRMTTLPAQKIGQAKRGSIQTGYFADLALLDVQNIRDNASYTDPHHYPSGVEYVFVNGVLVLKKGEMTGQTPGMWLKGKFVGQ